MPIHDYMPDALPLASVSFRLWVPEPGQSDTVRLTASGWDREENRRLWLLHETWSHPEVGRDGYEPSDAISHVVLVALQDRPETQAQMESCMIGEGWAQDALDWG